MAPYDLVHDWQAQQDEYVVAVTVRQTEDSKYPCGWDYSLHLGTLGDETLLRYDNAHERTKGHERHTAESVEEIDFPGMSTLYQQFRREVEEITDRRWTWP